MSDTKQTIRTVKASERKILPGPEGAPFIREEMFGDGHVWMGIVTLEPGCASPWHHHGNHETYAYVLEGEAVVEYGPGGSQRLEVTADGSLNIVPPGVPHREVNPGTKRNRLLIVRVGEGPPVIPLDGPPA